MIKLTAAEKAHVEATHRREMLGMRDHELAEIARLLRIVNHCLCRLLLILPARLGANSRVAIDLTSLFGLFKGVRAVLRAQKHRPENEKGRLQLISVDDFIKEGTEKNLK